MIQGLVGVLDLTAADLNLRAGQLDILMARKNFAPEHPVTAQPNTDEDVYYNCQSWIDDLLALPLSLFSSTFYSNLKPKRCQATI